MIRRRQIEEFYKKPYDEIRTMDKGRMRQNVYKYSEDCRMVEDFRFISEKVGSFCGKKILDIGSGWGWLCVKTSMGGGEPIGVGPYKAECQIARSYNALHHYYPPFIISDGRFLPFQDDTFDFIFCLDVLEHISPRVGMEPSTREEARKVINEAIRVLKSKSIFIITVPNGFFPIEIHSLLPVTYIPKFIRDKILNSPPISHCEEPPEVYNRKTLASLIDLSKCKIFFIGEEIRPLSKNWTKSPIGPLLYLMKKLAKHISVLNYLFGTVIYLFCKKI